MSQPHKNNNTTTILILQPPWQYHCACSLGSSEWKSVRAGWLPTRRPSCELDLWICQLAAIGQTFTHYSSKRRLAHCRRTMPSCDKDNNWRLTNPECHFLCILRGFTWSHTKRYIPHWRQYRPAVWGGSEDGNSGTDCACSVPWWSRCRQWPCCSSWLERWSADEQSGNRLLRDCMSRAEIDGTPGR